MDWGMDYEQDLTMERRLQGKDETIAELLEALEAFIVFVDASDRWFLEGTLEDAQEKYQVAKTKATEAIRKAEGE